MVGLVYSGMEIKIFFDDSDKITYKEGIVSFSDNKFICIDDKHIIPISRIIRIEVFNYDSTKIQEV